jgi:hypothetical protein
VSTYLAVIINFLETLDVVRFQGVDRLPSVVEMGQVAPFDEKLRFDFCIFWQSIGRITIFFNSVDGSSTTSR